MTPHSLRPNRNSAARTAAIEAMVGAIRTRLDADEHLDEAEALADAAAALDAIPAQVLAQLADERVVAGATTLRVGGSPFRCTCGCNVMTATVALGYRCNACGAEYEGRAQ